jgi:hypothetical protein
MSTKLFHQQSDSKSKTLIVDGMKIMSTGDFDIPSGDKYVFKEDGVSKFELNGGAMFSDTISELTTDAGVTVDGVLLKNGGGVFADGASIEVDIVNEATTDAGVTIDTTLIKDKVLKIDEIDEDTASNGITLGNPLKFSTNIPLFVAKHTGGSTGTGNGGSLGTGPGNLDNGQVFDSEINDVGSDYDNATGVFTAPYTGMYEFSCSMNLDVITNAAAEGYVRFYVTSAGADSGGHIIASGTFGAWIDSGGEVTMSGTKIFRLTADDKVHVEILITGEGGDTITVAAGSSFCGKLITI